jgi:hypothetical protein
MRHYTKKRWHGKESFEPGKSPKRSIAIRAPQLAGRAWSVFINRAEAPAAITS